MAVFGKKTVDDIIGTLTKMQAQLNEVKEQNIAEAAAATLRINQAERERKDAEAEALRAAHIIDNIGNLIS